MYDKKIREYTEYFAKAQTLPANATLVAGNGTTTINKGKTMNALKVCVCAKGDVKAAGVSVQLQGSDNAAGAYANCGPLFSATFSPAKDFTDGDLIASFPIDDSYPNWIKAQIGGSAGNTGTVDVFLEFIPR